MKDKAGVEVEQRSWLLTCPQCRHEARVPLTSKVRYCGVCGRGKGRDVHMNREPSELPPSQIY